MSACGKRVRGVGVESGGGLGCSWCDRRPTTRRSLSLWNARRIHRGPLMRSARRRRDYIPVGVHGQPTYGIDADDRPWDDPGPQGSYVCLFRGAVSTLASTMQCQSVSKSGRVPDRQLGCADLVDLRRLGADRGCHVRTRNERPADDARAVRGSRGPSEGVRYRRRVPPLGETGSREPRARGSSGDRGTASRDRLLLAANVLLSNGFEVPATTLLLGLPRDPSIGDESSLMELLEVAEKLLDEAEGGRG